MSGAANDTTRTADYNHCGMCGAKRCCGTPSYWPAHDCGARVARLEADLDRLAGPVCDHPPCKGKRAIEHQRCPSVGTIGCLLNYVHDMCSPRHHPSSPAIEAWLRERAK